MDRLPAPSARALSRRSNMTVVPPRERVDHADVWLDPSRLDPELRGLAGRVACIADARPIDEIRTAWSAGLVASHIERHDHALLDTIERVTTRLRAARLIDLPALPTQHHPGHRARTASRRRRRTRRRRLHAAHRDQAMTSPRACSQRSSRSQQRQGRRHARRDGERSTPSVAARGRRRGGRPHPGHQSHDAARGRR